jgi:hypothetical protein
VRTAGGKEPVQQMLLPCRERNGRAFSLHAPAFRILAAAHGPNARSACMAAFAPSQSSDRSAAATARAHIPSDLVTWIKASPVSARRGLPCSERRSLRSSEWGAELRDHPHSESRPPESHGGKRSASRCSHRRSGPEPIGRDEKDHWQCAGPGSGARIRSPGKHTFEWFSHSE